MAEPVITLYSQGRNSEPKWYNNIMGTGAWRLFHAWAARDGFKKAATPDKYIPFEHTSRTIIDVGGKKVLMAMRDAPNISYADKFDLVIKSQYIIDSNSILAPYPDNVKPFIPGAVYFDRNYGVLPLDPKYSIHCSLKSSRRRNHEMSKKLVKMLSSRKDVIYSKVNESFKAYINAMKSAHMVIMCPSGGDMTGRDVGAMAAQVPFFRPTYYVRTYNQVINGEHYWGLDGGFEAMKKFAEELPDRLHEKDFKDKCAYMVRNSKEWYENNASLDGSLSLFKKICAENL